MAAPPDARLSPSRVLSHLGVMAVVAAVLGVVVAGLAIPFAGVLGMGAKSIAETMDELPEELETESLPQRTTVVDADGNQIASLFVQNRVNVELTQVSRIMVKAIVAIEDDRFYEHGALDIKGTLRAFITNQANDGVVQGGSSISQQVVKQTLLQQAETDEERAEAIDDSYARKLRELRYAIALEERYSKDWILERYLNISYFGDGAYGIQAAAKHYFNVNAKQLDLRQSALLAGLVKSPDALDPTNDRNRALARRNVVLDRMAELNVISRERAAKVKDQPLGLNVQPNENGCVDSSAPFFCDYMVRYLMADRSLGRTKAERRRLIYSGGLTIRTTVDLDMQQAADNSVRANVFPQDSAIGGLAMVEPRSGEVRALAQSRPMGADQDAGQTFLNYVVPKKYGDSNGFQPGSTFKAFVLAAAINQDIPLNRTYNAPETISIPMRDYKVCDGEYYASSEIWSPSNSTSNGTFNLYQGTQLSVNTFFAQLERDTGLCEPYELAQAMGIGLDDPATQMVPSFTLGVADVSPLEMAEAYATFAGRGLHCDSRPVTALEDADGNVIKEYPATCQQVIAPATADAVNDVLRGVQEGSGFGAARGLALDQPSAAKTGTTQDGKAVWFVGYTPQLSTAAMIAGANEYGQPIPLAGQTIGGAYIPTASGSGFAGPMWGGAMQVIDDSLEYQDFVAPSADDIAGVMTTVPSVGGMGVDEAQAVLAEAGFAVSLGGDQYSSYPVGTVAFTSPGGGGQAGSGSTITIYTSAGPEPKGNGGGGGGNGGRGNGGGGGRGGR
ncbi:penicillin-binding protein [Nocardioides ferulae]|uniref:penicillin-binding protein n=1 Tax=Nocardioides ferulae TaxID=2340821 RepID=UPI000EAF494C|nr:transglycosylase domain-containing protein [Nocardioides ferulae]